MLEVALAILPALARETPVVDGKTKARTLQAFAGGHRGLRWGVSDATDAGTLHGVY